MTLVIGTRGSPLARAQTDLTRDALTTNWQVDQLGQVTAEIRAYYPPEPYKGKGVRIVGEHAERVRRKEGKTVA